MHASKLAVVEIIRCFEASRKQMATFHHRHAEFGHPIETLRCFGNARKSHYAWKSRLCFDLRLETVKSGPYDKSLAGLSRRQTLMSWSDLAFGDAQGDFDYDTPGSSSPTTHGKRSGPDPLLCQRPRQPAAKKPTGFVSLPVGWNGLQQR